MSLYDDLGIQADASPADVAKAHRAGAKRTHPDTGGEPVDIILGDGFPLSCAVFRVST
jgi:curved DNA-binding protein CbpA